MYCIWRFNAPEIFIAKNLVGLESNDFWIESAVWQEMVILQFKTMDTTPITLRKKSIE